MSAALRLPERTTLQTIAPLHEALCAAFAEPGDVLLDVSDLTEGDLGLVQLICAAKAQADSENRDFRLSPPDHPPLVALLSRAGLAPDFLETSPLG